MEQEQFVSCKTPVGFAAKTGLVSMDVNMHVVFETGFDEGRKASFEYPVIMETTSIRAVFNDARMISLPEPETLDNVDPSNHRSLCKNFQFLAIGEIVIAKEFLSAGNPFPLERYWAIDTKRSEPASLTDHIEDPAFLEQVTPDCIRNIERGSAMEPGRQDLWCATVEHARPRLVQRMMLLDQERHPAGRATEAAHAPESYWFRCDRSSGVATVSEQTRSISAGERKAVNDPDLLSRMHDRCEEWARKEPGN